ncbi:MAG: alkaline phosphatase family protein [Candidatus Vecturithrix sp.]|nr:alkaline phosphatase family protein [Candidatus Vecturithrix sp.]
MIFYWILGMISLIVLGYASPASAYIGPGAGFAVVSSFLILFVTIFVAFLTILIWPFRALWLRMKRRKFQKDRQVKRVVVIGLDGLDPALTQGFIHAGKLPNFQQLKEEGSFRPLQTTSPSISPVAWSTYATGVNPGKHRIFDFFTRNPKNYLPVLSSSEVTSYTKILKIGPLKIPFPKTGVNFLRKSTSFWKILGEHGIFCSVLRVPITFPPEKFYGTCLSAMCAPDVRGTQGSFTLFSSENGGNGSAKTGGTVVPLRFNNNRFEADIPGPTLSKNGKSQTLSLPLKGTVDFAKKTVTLKLLNEALDLKLGEYSPWLQLEFKAGFRKRISGIARFLVTDLEPEVRIYMTPINIDPEKPALPVSHPLYFSIGLSKLQGAFSTLGLAEDTWALNEGVINETAFLEQAYDIYEERKKHLFDSLKKNTEGFVTCVFDTTDRIQHMFFRHLDADHPSNAGKDCDTHKHAIAELYVKMDELIGEVRRALKPDDLLMVVSDHGFKPFKWGVNLNSWLWKEGYLVLKDGATPGEAEWFLNVDWPKTRAFAYALAGIFFNVKGRERDGIVEPGEGRLALQREMKARLEALVDEKRGKHPIRRCMLSQEVLHGPYLRDCPDLLVGYHVGYRASWNSAVGRVTNDVIEDNLKHWSGDHGIDPELVPGVFFSNWKLEQKKPALTDLAPTILSLFGIGRQAFHDGHVLQLSKP